MVIIFSIFLYFTVKQAKNSKISRMGTHIGSADGTYAVYTTCDPLTASLTLPPIFVQYAANRIEQGILKAYAKI